MNKLVVKKNGTSFIKPLSDNEIKSLENKAEETNERSKKEKKIEAYLLNGWIDAFALIDDILDRGLEAVKQDRDKIKQG